MRQYFLKRVKDSEHDASADSYMEELEESKLGDTRVIHMDESGSNVYSS